MPSMCSPPGVRSGRTRAGSGRRVGPPARPRTTRTVARRVDPPRTHRGARLSRRAMRPATSAGYPAESRWRWRKSRLGAVASERERSPETREEDALRTWTWKTASCGWTCGFGRGGDDGTRSAPGREARATRRRATDAGMSASSDEALHRWRCKTRSHPGAGSTPARAFATRHVSRTHLEVTDTLPATRAADMVMADMFVEGCAKVAARSARWNASNTHGLAFLSIKNLEPRSRFR